MKLIESSVEFLPQAEGLEGVYKQVEIAGRTCYKSEDKITEDSAKSFVDRMIASHHTAMLEHGTVYLCLPMEYSDIIYKYEKNQYSKVGDAYNGQAGDWHSYPIVSNLRVLVENNWLDDLQYLCSPTEFHEKRYTFKFITDRGVSHELVRHRVFSFAQESTRYCNYSKDKFNNEITYIIPSWMHLTEGTYVRTFTDDGFNITGTDYSFDVLEGFTDESLFLYHLLTSEKRYFALLDYGWKPQQARQVLPNALKTEIVVTGFASDWRHFFDLRMWGKTGAPHPDMLELSTKAMLKAQDAGIWMNIERQPSQFKQ